MRRLQKLLFAHRPPPHAHPLSGQTLEVIVQWGDSSVLHVAHSSPPRAFHVGSDGDAAARSVDASAADAPEVDFALDGSLLGCERLPLALVDGDQVRVLLPAGARAQLQLGEACIDAHELAAQGKLHPASEPPGAHSFALPLGGIARVALGELVFTLTLARSEAGTALAKGPKADWKGQRWTAASFAVHLALLGLFMFLPPASGVLALGEVNSRSHLIDFVIEARERPPEPPSWEESGQEGGSDPGERAKDEEGQAGTPDAPRIKQRGAARGQSSRPVLPVASTAPDPRSVGILGVLRSAQLTADTVFTAEQAEGNAVQTVFGGLEGAVAGVSFGSFGQGMFGTGRGGGGDASGTRGSGPLGTIGSGAGGHGPGSRYGRGAGEFGIRKTTVPRLRPGHPDVHGSLSKEAIRRTIRLHLAEVRNCYQERLIARPDLQGRLSVRFIISPTGVVQMAGVMGSDLHDAGAEQCIVKAVKRWSFPQPQGGGVVSVTYPFVFEQAGR